MPEFNVADVVTRLLRRVNFVGRPHPSGIQELRRDGYAKA
jgi:hypothetical protein